MALIELSLPSNTDRGIISGFCCDYVYQLGNTEWGRHSENQVNSINLNTVRGVVLIMLY